jgi:hypothetical protein
MGEWLFLLADRTVGRIILRWIVGRRRFKRALGNAIRQERPPGLKPAMISGYAALKGRSSTVAQVVRVVSSFQIWECKRGRRG